MLLIIFCHTIAIYFLNPKKAGLFEDRFFWGGGRGRCQSDPPSYFKKNLLNINIALYNFLNSLFKVC